MKFRSPVSILKLFTGLLAFTTLSAQTLPAHDLNARLVPAVRQQPSADNEEIPERSLWVEQEDKRTLYSSTYTAPGGLVIMQHSTRPVNYYNERGALIPIDPLLKPSENGWSAMQQSFPVFMYSDGSTALSLGRHERITFNRNCSINGQKVKGELSENGNHFIIEDVVPGIDKEYVFSENAVKYNYILKQPLSASTGITISEEIDIPAGYRLVRDKERGIQTKEGWSGDVTLVSPSGEIVSRFLTPVCYDANKKHTIGSYVIKEKNGTHVLEIIVPSSWLSDPARSYPVVIDPLVIGPTSLWASGTMPSCIIPAYNQDSIFMSIPAAISITGLYVTASFYADPFTTATMSQGSMYFSTNCGQTDSFVVTGPAGNTAGTAYLDSFNVFNPLMCCFMSSCQQRTFYLRMHLGRTGPSTGCNTTFIRYDPLTTQWPFKALVIGRTVESYGNQWLVPSIPICSNQCTINGTAYARYGVPPYTISHPWAAAPVTVGTLNGCNSGATSHLFTLTIPNCPAYCDTTSVLVVPPPTITDACGNTVSGLPSRNVPLKEAPAVTAFPAAPVICSPDQLAVSLTSCVSNSTVTWWGNNISGTGNISDFLVNNGTSADTINYFSLATANGCTSDTAVIPVIIDPAPAANFSYAPLPSIAGQAVSFTDNSVIYAGTVSGWDWSFAGSASSTQQNPSHVFAEPGNYTVCFVITTSSNCIDTVCREISVIAPDVIAPNVVTPNGDGMNDLLKFKYLEFFSGNTLEVYNRWGNLIYEKTDYANDWSAGQLNDGTYYYVLSVKDLDKVYKGFFEVLH